jgi:tetratricopeptide (TPR) repeat protein
VEIECFRVVELSTSLPGVRFPVDVSGGVARFRHRRGELQTLRLEMAARDLERWMAPRLGGLLGTRAPEVWIQVGRARSTVCVSAVSPDVRAAVNPLSAAGGAARDSADGGTDRDAPIVAFDVHALAEGEGLVLVVSNARGASLPEPPTAIAIACLGAVLGPSARRAGAVFTLPRPATLVVLALFPSAGARLPSTDGVRWAALAADGGTWVMHAARDADVAAPTDDALRAREVAALLAEADETLLRGDLSAARSLYLEVLERAPRHREIAARIVEIDARMPVRAEAALATIAESSREASGPSARDGGAGTGFVTGELLAQVGDSDAAVASFVRAGEAEPCPALAARAFELAARTSPDAEAASRWLDRALALAPRSVSARWRRVDARLTLGQLEDALADVEHLEALARGARGKYAVWLRAGRAWEAHGVGAHGGPIFERALRYAPDEPRALAGLGAALLGEGRPARGVSLLDRALEIVRSRGEAESSIRLALAKALAERLDDLPTAIAHVSAIPGAAPEASAARGLEGRWRARLGDLAGAALAFARLRDVAASSMASAPSNDADAQEVVGMLIEAAAMERDLRKDPLAAQRHLAVALRLLPHHAEARRFYREVGSSIARSSNLREDVSEPPVRPHDGEDALPPESEREDRAPMPALDLGLADDGVGDEDVERAARADELTRRLRDDPGNEIVAAELTSLLEDLSRGHELVALLVGRLEDAPPARREELCRHARAVFERMAARAVAAQRSEDAALYRDALASIDSV